jgi:SRSO17 transposase
MSPMNNTKIKSIVDPSRWGIPNKAVDELGDSLYDFWKRFSTCFKTKTRDTSEYAYDYLTGQLRMENDRNFANIARTAEISEQNLQHFISNSPWKASSVIEQVQQEIKETPELQKGNGLILDESADEKAGANSAAAGRQYLGRYGKVDMGQVGTFVSLVNLTGKVPFWTWIDAELYFPEHWFDDDMEKQRKRLGIPDDRKFSTKIELGWEMIQRCKLNGVPFEFVGCDALYGNSKWLRFQMRQHSIIYMADVSKTTPVYLNKPEIGVPESEPKKRGPKSEKVKVISEEKSVTVNSLIEQLEWEAIEVRNTERGKLNDSFASMRVFTIYEEEKNVKDIAEEILFVRRDANGKYSYSLSNESPDSSLATLANQKCQRYFIERANQDAKSEAGWDEFMAQKFRAWKHHTALCILACWFIAQTKLEWAEQNGQDQDLAKEFETDILPSLSFSNIRELLRAVMPLPQLTPDDAKLLIVKHLINRTNSRKSRMRKMNREKKEESHL